MKKTLAPITAALLAAFLVSTALPASAAGTTYAFRLMTPNVAAATMFDEHHAPGDTIRLTGSGTFDPTTGAVTGGGSFTHLGADGAVHMRGTWQADSFASFVAWGGPRNGSQGGVLQLAAVHLDGMGVVCAEGVPMTLTSAVGAPPGTVGGTTTGHFGQIVSGVVTFARI